MRFYRFTVNGMTMHVGLDRQPADAAEMTRMLHESRYIPMDEKVVSLQEITKDEWDDVSRRTIDELRKRFG